MMEPPGRLPDGAHEEDHTTTQPDPAETAKNHGAGPLPHQRGSTSMARTRTPNTPPKPRRQYIGVTDAADRLDVSPKFIRAQIAAGNLTAYRIGTKILRLDVAEVDALAVPVVVG